MKVAGVAISQAKTVSAEVTVAKTIEFMLAEDVSTLLVTDEMGRVAGIITESRLLACAFDPSLRADPISLHMERKLISIRPNYPLERIVETFILHRVRHLPVIGLDKQPLGILSRRELLRELIRIDNPALI